ncbi:hypothetical protein AB1484_27950 [Parafrankia sp. FMc6]|uniref:hypothetical protein n=1 Tax=Parafrankia soli TaxID=2599596 RepID=UPI0034D7AFAB
MPWWLSFPMTPFCAGEFARESRAAAIDTVDGLTRAIRHAHRNIIAAKVGG